LYRCIQYFSEPGNRFLSLKKILRIFLSIEAAILPLLIIFFLSRFYNSFKFVIGSVIRNYCVESIIWPMDFDRNYGLHIFESCFLLRGSFRLFIKLLFFLLFLFTFLLSLTLALILFTAFVSHYTHPFCCRRYFSPSAIINTILSRFQRFDYLCVYPINIRVAIFRYR